MSHKRNIFCSGIIVTNFKLLIKDALTFNIVFYHFESLQIADVLMMKSQR